MVRAKREIFKTEQEWASPEKRRETQECTQYVVMKLTQGGEGVQLAFVYWFGRFFNPKLLPIRAFYVDKRLLLGCYLEELGTFDDLLLLLLFCPVLPCAQDLFLSVSVLRGPYVVWGLNLGLLCARQVFYLM